MGENGKKDLLVTQKAKELSVDILSHKKSPPLRFIYCNEREGDLGTPILYFFKYFLVRL